MELTMNQEMITISQCNLIINQVSQYAISEYGRERIQNLKPHAAIHVVKKRLQETAEAKALLEANLHVPFMGFSGIEYLTSQVEKGFILEPTELTQYADFLRSIRLIKIYMHKNQFMAPLLCQYSETLVPLSTIEDRIYQIIKGNNLIDEASRSLKKIRTSLANSESEINKKLDSFLKNKQYKEKIQEALIVKKNERYTIPIKAAYKKQLAGHSIEVSAKGTTVFFEPSSIRKLNDKLMMLKAEEEAEKYQVLSELTGALAEEIQNIKKNIEVIAEYDMIFAKAKYSKKINGIEPELNQKGIIQFNEVSHPLLGEHAVPLSLTIGKEYRGLVITGPNAGGKTVVLKTVALTLLQTMLGIQICAKQGTNIALFDQLFADIGDQQSIEHSLSTFSGHLQNISRMYQQANANSLILLDEIGSGTEPNEGAALAIAIMEAFYQKGCILLATTHYGEIKEFAQQHKDFTTAAMAFDSETLTPKYKLLLGETGESNAFWIAEKMALDEKIIKQAKHYLAVHEYQHEKIQFEVTEDKPLESIPEVEFEKGDRVLWTEKKKNGIVYASILGSPKLKVYIDQEMLTVHRKQLRLQNKAVDLYPKGYDLDTLFEEFQVRKNRRDLERGSKKAYKRLQKNNRT